MIGAGGPILHILALAAVTAAAAPATVSTEWLAAHLKDPQVRIIHVGDAGRYALAHIPGARLLEQTETMSMGARHGLPAPDVLVRAFTKAGAADGAHVVLYGDSPMSIGWVYMALMSIGHGDEVSWLDGGLELWQREKRPVSETSPEPGTGPLTARAAPDLIVDSAWVRSRLESPVTKILDVRTEQEWLKGHLPNATLITWQDLFRDVKTQKFKSPDQIRSLLTAAGVGLNQEVVTYCAVGMRASLMFWAARSAGIPARVYVGSWSDWSRSPANPVAK
jgi:thiosulfate/3-mercaptopyruvate sulfurtransferase